MSKLPGVLDRRRFLAGVGVVAAAPAAAQSHLVNAWTAVQALLDRYIADKTYAGVAVALSYGGSPSSFLSAGTLAFDSRVEVTPDSLFRLYSVTKPVTGIAAMLLVEDGTIELDQPVGDVLPELRQMKVAIDPAKGLEARRATRPITMRQLLTHRSGLSNWQPFLGNKPISTAYRERGLTPGSYGLNRKRPGYGPQVLGLQALVEGVAAIPLIAEPGTAWNYSLGFDIMGAVIERASGRGLDLFMRERIFEPLEMLSTGFQIASSHAVRMTTLYGRTGDSVTVIDAGPTSDWLQPPTLIAGGGGLASSARDLIRFGTMLLRKGELNGRRVMKPETVDLAMPIIFSGGGAAPASSAGAPGVTREPSPMRPYSAVGASSTLLSVDPAHRGVAIFLAQLNQTGLPPAVATAFQREFAAAVEADLAKLP